MLDKKSIFFRLYYLMKHIPQVLCEKLQLRKGSQMIKKIISGILILILLLVTFFLSNRYHVIYSSACGSGVDGLKLLGIYIGILLLVLTILWINKRKRLDNSCDFCKSILDEKWKTCPYCGSELERNEKKP